MHGSAAILAIVVGLAGLFFGIERISLWEDAVGMQPLRIVAYNN